VQAALAAWMLNTLTQAAPPADAGDTQPGLVQGHQGKPKRPRPSNE
jgi:hypothetical protein